MKTEELKALGLSDEQVSSVMAIHGKDITKEQGIAKGFENERDAMKAQLETVSEQIKALGGKSAEDVMQQIATLEQKANEAEAKAQEQIAAAKLDSEITAALSGARAKNVKAVRALLDEDALKLTDNGILGLNEQLEGLKKDNAFLFDPEPSGGASFENKSAITDASTTNDFMNSLIRGSRGETN